MVKDIVNIASKDAVRIAESIRAYIIKEFDIPEDKLYIEDRNGHISVGIDTTISEHITLNLSGLKRVNNE